MKPVTKSSDAITYDPRKGFHVDLKSLQEPEGRYLCEARYNDLVRDVEYAITRKVKKIAPANLRGTRRNSSNIFPNRTISFLLLKFQL